MSHPDLSSELQAIAKRHAAETPRIPDLWWHPKWGLLELDGGIVWIHLYNRESLRHRLGQQNPSFNPPMPADAVKLGPAPRDVPVGMVPGDFYSPDDVIKLMAERDARIERSDAEVEKLRTLLDQTVQAEMALRRQFTEICDDVLDEVEELTMSADTGIDRIRAILDRPAAAPAEPREALRRQHDDDVQNLAQEAQRSNRLLHERNSAVGERDALRAEVVGAWCALTEGERDEIDDLAPGLHRLLERLTGDVNREGSPSAIAAEELAALTRQTIGVELTDWQKEFTARAYAVDPATGQFRLRRLDPHRPVVEHQPAQDSEAKPKHTIAWQRIDAALAQIEPWWRTGKGAAQTLMAVNSILRGRVVERRPDTTEEAGQ